MNVSKSYRTRAGRKVVVEDANFELPEGRSVGVLGANGSGKSTLIRLIAGVELPDRGRVLRRRRVSFPLGFGGTFHPHLSGRENIAFLARVYGADRRAMLRFVDDFAELGDYMTMPVETYSSGMRAKLAFGACLAIDFDVYLIDEVIAVGDARFQERCRAAFDRRMEASDIVMVSHNSQTIRSYCDAGAVLSDGRLRLFDSIDEAIRVHAARMVPGAPAREPA